MKILVAQTSFLGDMVLSTPLIEALSKSYQKCEISLLTTPLAKELVVRDPLVKNVITFDKRDSEAGIGGIIRKARELALLKFDRAYGLQRSFRTSMLLALAGIPERIGFSRAAGAFLYHQTHERIAEDHEVLRNLAILSGLSMPCAQAEVRLFAPALSEVHEQVQMFLQIRSSYVVIAPGSAWHTKMWHWSHFRSIARYFLNRGVRVAVVGSIAESNVCEQVSEGLEVNNFCDKISISELMLVVKRALMVVCNDSMPLHLASGFKVPCVAVFCATSPKFGFGPWGNVSEVVEKSDLDCKPCRRHGGTICPTGTESCMKDLPAEKVIEAIERVERQLKDEEQGCILGKF